MAEIRWQRYPRAAEFGVARSWLVLQANLGLAANTLDAYARAVEEYLAFSADKAVPVTSAGKDHIAAYVRELTSRPNPRGANVLVLDSGAGLANATLQQRITAVRLFYDYLMEEGLRSTNPVGRGRYTPGKGFGGARDRGLIPRFTKLPWIPNDQQWESVLEAARKESFRNRMMLALSYDSALRREELYGLATSDIDPAHRIITIRAETTKTRRARVVPYSRSVNLFMRHGHSTEASLPDAACSGRDRRVCRAHSPRGIIERFLFPDAGARHENAPGTRQERVVAKPHRTE
jgi:site-specific recombinase XerD